MLLEQIVRAQQGSSEDMEALAEKFGPLLKKYSRKLFWEDALSDLTVAFLELIQTFPVDRLRSREDGVIVNYIVRSVHHTYIALLRDYFSRPQEVASLDDAAQTQRLETIAYVDKQEASAFLDLLDLCPELTERERTVLTQVFFWGYTRRGCEALLYQQAEYQSDETAGIGEDAKNNKKYAGLRFTFMRRIALSLIDLVGRLGNQSTKERSTWQ